MPVALERGFHLGDPFAIALLFVGAVVFVAIASLSHEHERPYSSAILYLGFGVAAGAGLGLLDVDRLDPLHDGTRILERVAELGLIVAVFAGGLSVERVVTNRSWLQVGVLLVVVLPLTIGAVALFGVLAMGLSLGAAIALGAILAPTDPVLAGDVGLGAPGEYVDSGEPRFSLHTEAAVNDGLAAPFVLLGLYIADLGGSGWLSDWVLADVVYGVGGAVAFGAAGGTAIAAGTLFLRDRDWLSHDYDAFVSIASVLVVYGAAQALGTYGFVAVFFAGFAFRRWEFHHEVNRRVHEGADVVGTFLELAVLLLLGSTVTTAAISEPGLAGWLLAPLLLFVIRPVLVFPLSDRRLMKRTERLFLGWFGVRGVAAIYYTMVVVHSGVLSADEASTVFWTATAVVAVSIVVHGISAATLTRRWLDEGA